MGKRRGRCARNNKNANNEPEELVQAPHSFVIHKGIAGDHITQLTMDFRKVMEPFTATSLKERKKNAIKDFVSVAGLLHVSHLSIFSRTELGMNLKFCKLPRGPTLTFRIHNFSLARDVVSSLKKQFVVEESFKHSPLIVLNSFSGEGLQMKLMASMFQNMFPTLNLTTVDLNTVRRCVLMNYNASTHRIDFRHYAIKVVPVGLSKGVKKVVQGKIPNLTKCNDISEFFSKTAVMSESEAEDDPSNHVTLSQKIISRGNVEEGKSSIKLTELGPRLSLELIKIEDGLMEGEVLYHSFIEKNEEEKLAVQKRRDSRRKLKENRKRIQDQNMKQKEHQKQELKEKSLQGMQKSQIKSNDNDNDSAADVTPQKNDSDDDDVEHYRREVGEEPDRELFSSSSRGAKRSHKPTHFVQNKKIKTIDGGFKKNGGVNFHRNDGTKASDTRFKKNFNNRKNKKVDKTNSHNRDHRPVGGGNRKFNRK